MKRLITIISPQKSKELELMLSLLEKEYVKKQLKEYNLVVKTYIDKSVKSINVNLIGYDGMVKKSYLGLDKKTLQDMFQTIDTMPMRKLEKKQSGGNVINHYKNKYTEYKIKYMHLKYIADTI
jgi:hypothetical protein